MKIAKRIYFIGLSIAIKSDIVDLYVGQCWVHDFYIGQVHTQHAHHLQRGRKLPIPMTIHRDSI